MTIYLQDEINTKSCLDPDVIAAGDLSAARIGKLSAAGDVFEVENIGELEFEAEENELSLTVESVVGEFAIFAPIAGAAVEGAAAGAGNATAVRFSLGIKHEIVDEQLTDGNRELLLQELARTRPPRLYQPL